MKNTKVKNEINKKEKQKIAETLAAVYIYIYIYMVLSFRHKRKLKYAENKNVNRNINKQKDRTVLKEGNTGLSLCSSISKEKIRIAKNQKIRKNVKIEKIKNIEKNIKVAKRDGGFLQFLANKDGPPTLICYQEAIQKRERVGGTKNARQDKNKSAK